MRDTSLLAYQQVQPHLGEQQQTVLVFVNAYPDQTDREYAELAGMKDPATFRRRRSEVEDMGYIKSSGKRTCKVTGKLAHTWRINRP